MPRETPAAISLQTINIYPHLASDEFTNSSLASVQLGRICKRGLSSK